MRALNPLGTIFDQLFNMEFDDDEDDEDFDDDDEDFDEFDPFGFFDEGPEELPFLPFGGPPKKKKRRRR